MTGNQGRLIEIGNRMALALRTYAKEGMIPMSEVERVLKDWEECRP